MRALLLAIAACCLPAAALADPPPTPPPVALAVAVSDASCTTEPAPRKPILRARAARAGTARLRVIGRGALCQATWRASRQGRQVTVGAFDADEATACGTCAAVLTLSPLPGGEWTVTVEGASLRVRTR